MDNILLMGMFERLPDLHQQSPRFFGGKQTTRLPFETIT